MAMTVWKKALLESRQEGRNEGRLDGRDEGRREERSNMLVKLIEDKFGSLPEKLLNRVNSFDEKKVIDSHKRLHSANSIADLQLDQD
jgi:predicted transposase YdaD